MVPAPTAFLSHASEDKAGFVEPLARELASMGINPWLDKWEIRPGDSLVRKLFDDGLAAVDAVIVVVSRYSAGKPWVRAELDTAMVRRITHNTRLIPIRLDGADMPVPLRALVWHDAVRTKEGIWNAAQLIADTLHGRDMRPVVAPPPAADGTKIGIWGPPKSGKTTYLTALRLAANHNTSRIGQWSIYSRDQASKERLLEWTERLVDDHEFPDLSDPNDFHVLRWCLMGDLSGSRYMRRKAFRSKGPYTQFDIELIDVSGEVFGYRPADKHVKEETIQRTMDHLASSYGLVMLFDPIAARDFPAEYRYVDRVLADLGSRMLRANRIHGRFLPHHVAVCITKTDDPELHRQARRAGLVFTDEFGVERVLDAQAEKLLDSLCYDSFWDGGEPGGGDNARYFRSQLKNHFAPGRISYHAISAIGNNALYYRDGKITIVGPIQPFNVLEPLVELQMRLQAVEVAR